MRSSSPSRRPSRSPRGLPLIGLVALVALASAFPLLAHAQERTVLGRWQFVGGAAEVRAISQAIDAALADFNPVMREIVASQLRDTNRAYPEFSIAVEGDNIVSRINGRTLSTPASGAAREVTTPEGRSAQVTQRIQGSRLIQTLVNPQGTRTHTVSVGSDGNLTVEVRIESSHLPRPIRYTLTYGRAA
ncbi:MAG: hypothetical protein H6725_01450 [Sandaracinaceae bacterium]|nr:hypothetical protein [Sandaracinaceae bacterium]